MNFNNFILKIFLLFCCFSNIEVLHAQVGLGTNAPDASAVLDLTSTTQGFYIPRMTFTQMTAISTPTLGLMVYCTDCEPQGMYHYDGSYFLNSNRGAVSGNLDAFVGYSPIHSGSTIDTSILYGPSDGITTDIAHYGWSGGFHNPISFASTGRLGYLATLVSLTDIVVMGVLENGTIPDSQLTADSSLFTAYPPSEGRLNRPGLNWFSGNPADTSHWYQVDLGQIETVVAVATQGSNGFAQWIKSYKLLYSLDGMTFTEYDGGRILTGNTDMNTVVRNNLGAGIRARYVRFNPQSWEIFINGRFEVYIASPGVATFQITGRAESISSSMQPTFNVSIGGQLLSFTRALQIPGEQAAGLESGVIADSQLSASSSLNSSFPAHNARLNRTGNNWSYDPSDSNPHFQVDLGQIEMVSAVASQGRENWPQWVSSYSIQYSNDNVNFTDYNGGAVFAANTDQNTIVRNDLRPTISARYIRILPLTFNDRISARFEVYIIR